MCSPHPRVTMAAVFMAALLVSTTAAAQAPPAAIPDAPIAVTGQVVSTTSRWDRAGGAIVTFVEIAVRERLRGDVPDRIVLKQLGGEVDGIGMWVADQASFRTGEDALLFLAISPRDRTLHTFGLSRGKRSVADVPLADVRRALGSADRPQTSDFVAVPAEYADAPTVSSPAFAFLPTGPCDLATCPPPRWHEVDEDQPVFVDHPAAVPNSWSGTTANASAAINLWRGSGMELDLRDGGATLGAGQCAANFTGNGRIAVSYNDPCNPPVPDSAETWVVGGGYYTTGDLRTVNGIEFQKFVQGFVVLNNVGPQTSATGCFQDAITHGLGHALGLGHTNSAGAMMETLPSGSCGSGARGLSADDVNGITTIYRGIAIGPNPPQPPTSLTATAQLSTVILSWTAAGSGGPAQRHLVDAGNTTSNVYNLGTAVVNTSGTSTAFSGVPAGTYFIRVRAQNSAGTSGPSNEAQVTVGGCAPPNMPGAFSATTNGTNVNLLWSPPAGGVTQGYRLVVGTAPGLANVLVADYPASVTSLGAVGVPYATYYARVLATNVCGVSAPSNEVTIVVQPCSGPPTAPTNLVFGKSGNVVSLAWGAPAGPAPSSYTLVVGSVSGGSDILVFPTGNTGTALGTTAPNGTYFVRVVAQNACGVSSASNEVVITVP